MPYLVSSHGALYIHAHTRTHSYTSLHSSLASHPYFSSWCACAGGRGRGKGRKNTSGKMCKVFVLSAGMLVGPIKFEHSK